MSTPTPTPNPRNNPFLTESSTPPQFSKNLPPDPSDAESDNAALSEELPPAYTPTPDPEQGESSVEFGPRRPFQQAPPPVQQQLLSPHTTTTRSSSHGRSQSHSRTNREQQTFLGLLTGHPSSTEQVAAGTTRSEVFTYPGNRRQAQQPALASIPVPVVTESRSARIPAPPPRHPTSSPSSTSLSSSTGSNRSGISDFARDFYAAGPASNLIEPESSASTPPQPRYAPPPGAPPPPRNNTTQQGIPDDGRPTKTAVPGHPLLKDDQILIYPAGHMCEKCEYLSLCVFTFRVLISSSTR
jgi:hypothetical protein